MTKDEVKKLWMDSPESLQFLNNATKFYNLMMMYRWDCTHQIRPLL